MNKCLTSKQLLQSRRKFEIRLLSSLKLWLKWHNLAFSYLSLKVSTVMLSIQELTKGSFTQRAFDVCCCSRLLQCQIIECFLFLQQCYSLRQTQLAWMRLCKGILVLLDSLLVKFSCGAHGITVTAANTTDL